MNIFQAFILGILQGITEFLPISSSGHLILLPSLLGWEIQSLAFDAILHLGTATALIVFFWRDLLAAVKSKRYLSLILIGSIPVAILGFILGGFIESNLRSAQFVIMFLLLGSLIMFLAEIFYKKKWHSERINNVEKLSLSSGLIVGGFQSLALFSGVSRSGSTIAGGILVGLTREVAARFSFILSIPVVIGAGVFKIIDSYGELYLDPSLLIGFLSSTVTGILVIGYLLKYLKTNNLYIFIIYRVLLVFLVILSFA